MAAGKGFDLRFGLATMQLGKWRQLSYRTPGSLRNEIRPWTSRFRDEIGREFLKRGDAAF